MKKEHKYLNLTLDLIVVFLGVTAAFFLNQLAENRKERKIEKVYVRNIYDELLEDERQINAIIKLYDKKGTELLRLASLLKDKRPLNEIEPIISEEMFTFRFFKGNMSTWESMKGSGEIKIIKNTKIKILLTKLFNHYLFMEKRNSIIENFIQNNLLQYGLKNWNMLNMNTGKGFLDKTSPFTTYFINTTMSLQLIVTDFSYGLKKTLQILYSVKSELKKELQTTM